MKSDSECRIFDRWNKNDQLRARNIMVGSILATDMAIHNDLVAILANRVQVAKEKESTHSNGEDSQLPARAFDLAIPDERNVFYRMILHAADISNSVRPRYINFKLATDLCDEFDNQTKMEKALGLDVTAFMVKTDAAGLAKGEIGFITYVARPFWMCVADIDPAFGILLVMAGSNIKGWQAKLNSL